MLYGIGFVSLFQILQIGSEAQYSLLFSGYQGWFSRG